MNPNALYLVPVLVRKTYTDRHHKRNYTATVAILADEGGNVLSAGVGFQGNEYDGKKVAHSKKIGRDVAMGRAIKAYREGQDNSITTGDCPQLERVERDFNGTVFGDAKGVYYGGQIEVPETVRALVEEAIKSKTRVAISEGGKWSFEHKVKV